MLRRLSAALALLLVVVGVSACETAPGPAPLPPLNFRDKTLIRLDVGRVDFLTQYVPPLREPNVEHKFPVSPTDAVRVWINDRLQAAGMGRTLRVVVKEGSIVEEKLAVDKGVKGLFKEQQEARYTMTLDVDMSILDERQVPQNFASARVFRSRTVPEGLSLNERDRMWFDLVKDAMADFNTEMERNMRQYMAPHIL